MDGYHAHLTLLEREGSHGLLLWVDEDEPLPPVLRSPFSRGVWLEDVPIFTPDGDDRPDLTPTHGWWLPAGQAAAALAELSMGQLRRLSTSVGLWALASKWVVEAVAYEQVVPTLDASGGEPWHSAWRVAPVRADDRARLANLAECMPGVARAAPLNGDDRVLTAGGALSAFLDGAADGLMRAPTFETSPIPGEGPAWVVRLAKSLAGPDPTFVPQGLADRSLPAALELWVQPATSVADGDRPIVGFRLEEPKSGKGRWRISYHLLDPGGAGRVSASQLRKRTKAVEAVASEWTQPEETLLAALGRASGVFPAIDRSLSEELPAGVVVDAAEAWEFLTRASLHLERAGFSVEVPRALSKVGQRRVRGRMRLGVEEDEDDAPQRRDGSGLLAGLVNFRWEASLGEDTLTAEEFLRLAESKAPLVYHRGQWVAVDPEDMARLKTLMKQGGGTLSAAEALRLALSGEVGVPEVTDATADVVTEGAVTRALQMLQEGVSDAPAPEDVEPPASLNAELRHYQLRGYAWLRSVTSTGFGACLADDMGLGKTVQALALMTAVAEKRKGARFLVVCPTSVIGNWRREVRRFAPEFRVVVHHGPSRAQTLRALTRRLDGDDPGGATVVVTSYALARGDVDLLRQLVFDVLALDEAQNIKNPEAAQSQAVRQLAARRRIALTGTPVENRLTELWSIVDFLNEGLLGSRTSFKKTFAVPVERYGDTDAAERLRRVTSPFILRRMKTDPTIAPELPDKDEIVRYCPLTREQAALYQNAIDAGMEDIAGMQQGMKRRGRILAMLTQLKQICNHPAHFLGDGDVSPRRSGKLIRFLELVDEVIELGGAALVFTQYREMGNLLSGVLEQRVGGAPFLHGGLSRNQRERMVADFQDPGGPPLLIVSLRAGGTGLNLTRANHVFHYDRWWNPAVEDQATDRAFRIGQTRDVTVHRLVSQGTLEEQIHQMLEDKRNLADRVIDAGEKWLSELDDGDLQELVTLGQDAVLEEDG